MEKSALRRGFTLVELVVVIGIIAVLMAVAIAGYSKYIESARVTKCHDKVIQVETALCSLKGNTGWNPELFAGLGGGDGRLDKTVARVFARNGNILTESYSGSGSGLSLRGNDRCGVVTPWAEMILRDNKNANEGTAVPSGGTVKDHIFHYAIDVKGLGYTEASVGGRRIRINKMAAVWCCGPNGEFEPYGEPGSDDIYSWTEDQVKN